MGDGGVIEEEAQEKRQEEEERGRSRSRKRSKKRHRRHSSSLDSVSSPERSQRRKQQKTSEKILQLLEFQQTKIESTEKQVALIQKTQASSGLTTGSRPVFTKRYLGEQYKVNERFLEVHQEAIRIGDQDVEKRYEKFLEVGQLIQERQKDLVMAEKHDDYFQFLDKFHEEREALRGVSKDADNPVASYYKERKGRDKSPSKKSRAGSASLRLSVSSDERLRSFVDVSLQSYKFPPMRCRNTKVAIILIIQIKFQKQVRFARGVLSWSIRVRVFRTILLGVVQQCGGGLPALRPPPDPPAVRCSAETGLCLAPHL